MIGPSLLAALVWLPRTTAGAEAAHDLGLDGDLRGTITLAVDLQLVRGAGWRLDIFTQARTVVRENTSTETKVRISPQHIAYPVGARLRFPLEGAAEWGLFAYHQSEHDIDTDDARLNDETVSFEVYGAEYVLPRLRVGGGLYYDRGSRLDGSRQKLPFDYYLLGGTVSGWLPFFGPTYGAGSLTAIALLEEPWVHVAGHVDAGWRLEGDAGEWRAFLRFQRISDYRYLGDSPRHLLLIGTSLGTL